MVEIPRIMRGEKQEFETIINEEAFLFAKYLRNERQSWNPRIACLNLRSGDISRSPKYRLDFRRLFDMSQLSKDS